MLGRHSPRQTRKKSNDGNDNSKLNNNNNYSNLNNNNEFMYLNKPNNPNRNVNPNRAVNPNNFVNLTKPLNNYSNNNSNNSNSNNNNNNNNSNMDNMDRYFRNILPKRKKLKETYNKTGLTNEDYKFYLMDRLEEIYMELIDVEARKEELNNAQKEQEERNSTDKINLILKHIAHLKEQKTGMYSLRKLKRGITKKLQKKLQKDAHVRGKLTRMERLQIESPKVTARRLKRIYKLQQKLPKVEERLQKIYEHSANIDTLSRKKRAEYIKKALNEYSFKFSEPLKSWRTLRRLQRLE